MTPLSISDARLSACIFVGSLSIRRPDEIRSAGGRKEENRILRTVKLFGLVEIAHLVMT